MAFPFDVIWICLCAFVGFAIGKVLMDYILHQGFFKGNTVAKEFDLDAATSGVKMKSFSAAQARRITEEQLRGDSIAEYVNTIADRINLVARDGRSSFDPVACLASRPFIQAGKFPTSPTPPMPTFQEWNSIRKHFELLGYKWKHHRNPEPTNPKSHNYTSIEW